MKLRPYSIGSKIWPGLSKLIEEAGEVVQVAGKLLGTGGELEHWDGTNLKDRLEEEMGDLLAACDYVVMKCGLDGHRIEKQRAKKVRRFLKWHKEKEDQ
ncbi:MAG: hypothetical protein ACYDHY_06665 [Acidiferrobacterales bacterium]